MGTLRWKRPSGTTIETGDTDEIIAKAAQLGWVLDADDEPEPRLDARGLPWDSRINVKSRTMDRGGNWKIRSGLDAGLVEQIEAELYAAQWV